MLSKKAVSVIQYIFFLGIGALLLWLGFRKLELEEVWKDILQADYGWLFAGLAFAIVSHIFRAMRWNLLINSSGYKTRLSSTIYSVMIGYLANTAVPRMGEIARCGVLSKKERIPFNTLFGTVISERVFDLLVLGFIILLMIALQVDLVGGFVYKVFEPILATIFSNMVNITIVSILSLLLLAGLLYLVLYFKNHIKKLPFYNKIREFIDGILDGVKTIVQMKQKWLFLLYTAIVWLCYIIMVYLPFKMLQETSFLSFLDGSTVMALGSLGIVAPVPGGIGAYHYITKVILTELYAVEANAAMSYATIAHAGQTILNVGLGALSYLAIGIAARKQRPMNE
jgi:uncharacterized protein (TIRG00374 family)